MRPFFSRRLVVGSVMLGLASIGFGNSSSKAPAAALSTSQVEEERDVQTVKQRLRESLLSADSTTQQAVQRDALALRTSLRADGSWPDVDYADKTRGPWKTSAHLDRVLTLAKAYRAPNATEAERAAFLAPMLGSLDFWLRSDFQNPNWWHNQIGVPQLLGNLMLLVGSDATAAQLDKAVSILKRSTLKGMTGANLVWMARNQVVRGCLENAPAVMVEAFNAIWNEIHIAAPKGEGIQSDWSFHQHGQVLYNGGYGADFTSDCAQFIAYARGTRFAVSDERLRLFENFLLDGQQWMVRGIFYDYGVIGRQIVRANQTAGGLQHVTDILAAEPGPRRAELANFNARLKGLATSPPLIGNRHFWMSDFMTHHRPGYYTSARMFSTRTFNTDGYINSEGKKSHHLADGVTYIFRRGDEYKDIFPAWDWRRVPGITAEQSAAPLEPARLQSKGKTDFVGGVSDGNYGAATMHFAREALTARKSWFYFDDEFVCLGAGLSSTSDHAVLTSLNQALLNGEVRVSAQATPLARGEHDLPAASWVWHDGIGYLFSKPSRVHVKNEAQRGSWAEIGAGSDAPVSRDVFSVWLDHGTRPTDTTYEYIVVPGITAQALATRANARTNTLEILSNTPGLQAVRHRALKVLQAVLHQPGTLAGGPGWTLTSDQPCLVLLREIAGRLQVTVSNPQNQALEVNLQIDRALEGEGSTSIPEGSRLRFILPAGAQAGRSISHVFQEKPR